MEAFNGSVFLLDRVVSAGAGDRVALRIHGDSVSYGELLERVCAATTGLRRLGVAPEQRVAMVLLDGVEFVTTFLAALRLGAIPLPLNPMLPDREVALIVADSRARVAVLSSERSSCAAALIAHAPELADVVVVGPAEWGSASRIRMHSWVDLLSGASDDEPHPTWDESPGFWLCTSGTTGRPKLAMHRHVDLRLVTEGYAHEVLGLTAADRCYSVGPMFHAYGLGNSLTFPFAVGAASILEAARPPKPARVAEIARSERPTVFFCVPTFYAALLAADLPADTFSSVRVAVSAAEPLPPDLYTRFLDRFGVEILDGIGSTELTHIYISNRQGSARAGSSGTPLASYRIRLEDDEGRDVGHGTPGQMLVSGASLATGYWCRSGETRARFCGEWFRTGDMYTRSADGYYTYLGRTDDMFKVSGEWVSPAEVEAVLAEYPDILEASVVGERNADGLTEPVAYVVAVANRVIDAEDVLAFCRGRLAGFKRPRRVVVVDELPKTVTGKIQRSRVRELAATQSSTGR